MNAADKVQYVNKTNADATVSLEPSMATLPGVSDCVWIQNGDLLQEVCASVYQVTKSSGKYFLINQLNEFFVTAAHCLEDHTHCVTGLDLAVYNAASGIGGDMVWPSFRNQLASGRFNNQIVGRTENFKAGDSGLLCVIEDYKSEQRCRAGVGGFVLLSGATTEWLCNGLLPQDEECGSAGCVVGGKWQPRDAIVRVFAGEREMFGVKWLECEDHSKTLNRTTHPFHILNAEQKRAADSLHQFPDLVTDKIHDLKKITSVKLPKKNSNECLVFELNSKVFSWHQTDNRLIFAVLPAFQSKEVLTTGTPIFNADTNELVSCVTRSCDNKVYAVSGIGWESGQVEIDKNWIGISCQYVGSGESVYGTFHGPYDEVKNLALAKASETLGEKTGLRIYLLKTMVQVVAFDENGKERWRIRLFHENCHIADI